MSVVAADRPCSSVAAELSPEGPVSATLDTTGVWIAPAPEQDMRTSAPSAPPWRPPACVSCRRLNRTRAHPHALSSASPLRATQGADGTTALERLLSATASCMMRGASVPCVQSVGVHIRMLPARWY